MNVWRFASFIALIWTTAFVAASRFFSGFAFDWGLKIFFLISRSLPNWKERAVDWTFLSKRDFAQGVICPSWKQSNRETRVIRNKLVLKAISSQKLCKLIKELLHLNCMRKSENSGVEMITENGKKS